MTNATVCLGFDFDAVAVWLHGYDALDSPTKRSRGEYGANVAVPRLLDLLDREGVTATFFTPGHTIESFPDVAGEVSDRGHDIQHHGWSHTNPSAFESKEAERRDIVRGIESVRDLTGERPSGYRSPAWDFSAHTLDLLDELGFAWDSSQMGHDFEPYYLRTGGRVDPEEPYDSGEETEILEFPVSWHRDDWPPFQFVPGVEEGGAAPDEERVFGMWREQFDWMCDHVDGGVFSLTLHPQVVGQPPRPKYLSELLRHMREAGARFETFDSVAARF